MAQRRMFSLHVVNTDRFQSMPFSAQVLYYQLGMYADDDGIVDSPKRIAKSLRCKEKDLQLLAERGWIIPFDSGVVAITDWKINNSIKSDRYCETVHVREKSMLQIGPDKRYVLVSNPEPVGIQNGSNLDPQNRIDKVRVEENRQDETKIEKINIEKISAGEGGKTPAPAKAMKKTYGKHGWIQLSQGEYSSLVKELGLEELEKCITYVDAAAQATGNIRNWRDWSTVLQMCHLDNWGKESHPDSLLKNDFPSDKNGRVSDPPMR